MVEGGKYGFLDPMTENCSRLVSYHDMVMVVSVGVMLVVLWFLVFALYRRWLLAGYSCRFKTKCNWLEFCWTLIPGLILTVLGYFSWENLYLMEVTDKASYHVKVVGHQWYWEYEYFLQFLGGEASVDSVLDDGAAVSSLVVDACSLGWDESFAVGSSYLDVQEYLKGAGLLDCVLFTDGVNSSFGDMHLGYDSYGVDGKAVRAGVFGLEEVSVDLLPFLGQSGVNQILYLPLNKTTEVIVCTADVIHSWGVPALGVKMDAVPGRANHLGVHPFRVGYAYGNCYELCGYGHSVMPITVLVVPESDFLGVIGAMVRRAVSE
uniref:cytochrome c oxidase subunit II n=1 Tax=Lithoredo abatanica TaxID=2586797 RepID=UPI0020280C35|nr:cytochrome c oxidase subunit II [Lithoredo abatanica]UPX89230.1 cytochrome c oxidase subunit 2 [Lithoredo abatanica]UPX89242.1 cytochrome c oxidase subunit 2 [Lithoredo abatanica]